MKFWLLATPDSRKCLGKMNDDHREGRCCSSVIISALFRLFAVEL
jgi:hypothetical protein